MNYFTIVVMWRSISMLRTFHWIAQIFENIVVNAESLLVSDLSFCTYTINLPRTFRYSISEANDYLVLFIMCVCTVMWVGVCVCVN